MANNNIDATGGWKNKAEPAAAGLLNANESVKNTSGGGFLSGQHSSIPGERSRVKEVLLSRRGSFRFLPRWERERERNYSLTRECRKAIMILKVVIILSISTVCKKLWSSCVWEERGVAPFICSQGMFHSLCALSMYSLLLSIVRHWSSANDSEVVSRRCEFFGEIFCFVKNNSFLCFIKLFLAEEKFFYLRKTF